MLDAASNSPNVNRIGPVGLERSHGLGHAQLCQNIHGRSLPELRPSLFLDAVVRHRSRCLHCKRHPWYTRRSGFTFRAENHFRQRARWPMNNRFFSGNLVRIDRNAALRRVRSTADRTRSHGLQGLARQFDFSMRNPAGSVPISRRSSKRGATWIPLAPANSDG